MPGNACSKACGGNQIETRNYESDQTGAIAVNAGKHSGAPVYGKPLTPGGRCPMLPPRGVDLQRPRP